MYPETLPWSASTVHDSVWFRIKTTRCFLFTETRLYYIRPIQDGRKREKRDGKGENWREKIENSEGPKVVILVVGALSLWL